MKIISIYRSEETELQDRILSIRKYDDGSIRLEKVNMWDSRNKHYYVDLDPHELLKLRDSINEQLGDLAGVKITSVTS